MSYSLFIADLHLDTTRPAVTAGLVEFLKQHQACEALYILGDLFEAWVGDDDDSALTDSVKTALLRYTSQGPSLFFMQGNRDFLLGDAFCHEAGGQLLPDPTVIDLYGTPTLLMHGDTLCTRDVDYLTFRATARAPAWQAAFLAKSLEERRAYAAELRRQSQQSTSTKAQDIMDVTPAEVERVMAEHDVTQLIHGHTHRPARHEQAQGVRWVLGDWGQSARIVRASPGNINIDLINLIQ